MSSTERVAASACLVLVVASILPTLPVEFYREGEAREAEVTADIVINGNVVAPHPGRIPNKPFALHWLSAIASEFGGMNEVTLRLSAFVFFSIAVLFLYLLAKKLYGTRTAVLSCLIFSVFPLALKYSTMYRVDMPLCAFTTACLYFLVWGVADGSRWLLFFAGTLTGIGFISKGPVIYATVLIPAILWIVINKTPVLTWKTSLAFLSLGLVAGTALVAIWAIAALQTYDTGGLDVLASESFLRSTEAHGASFKRPFYWYLPVIAGSTFPFVIAFLAGIVEHGKTGLKKFDVVASISVLVFFSLSSYKREVYLLPMFPLAAIVCARVEEFSITRRIFGVILVLAGGALFAVSCYFSIANPVDVKAFIEQRLEPASLKSTPLLIPACAAAAIGSILLVYGGLGMLIESRPSKAPFLAACGCAVVFFIANCFLGFGSAEVGIRDTVKSFRGKIYWGAERDHAISYYSRFDVEYVTDIPRAIEEGKRILLLEKQLADLRPGTFVSEFAGYSSSGSNDKMYLVRKK